MRAAPQAPPEADVHLECVAMRQPSLIRHLQSFLSPAGRPSRPHPLRLETLEDRTVLSATLYVDFGDRFPNGGLTGTVDNLINLTHNGNPAVNGPPMDQVGFKLTDPI